MRLEKSITDIPQEPRLEPHLSTVPNRQNEDGEDQTDFLLAEYESGPLLNSQICPVSSLSVQICISSAIRFSPLTNL